MITTKQMKELEDKSEELGVSKKQLMENAGKGIASSIEKRFSNLGKKNILIICYHGNNGGDGFVAAHYLSEKAKLTVLFIGDEEKLKEESAPNLERIKNNKKITLLTGYKEIDFNNYHIIIDAILGTGTNGLLREPIAEVIDKINKSSAYKVSVDIPTGLDPDTGEIKDKIINADLIITFHDLKTGLNNLKEKTKIVDIGIPKSLKSI